MTKEQRVPSPQTTKTIAPHKLMRTWRYKETKHSLKKKAKAVTLNFPLSLCSFTAKDNPVPSSPSTSPIFFATPPPSPTTVPSISPPPSPSPITPRVPSPCHLPPLSPPTPSSITLPPIPVNSPTHEFYFDQRGGLRSIAYGVSRPRIEDPLAYFKSLSTSDKIKLPVPSLPQPVVYPGTPQSAPLICYG